MKVFDMHADIGTNIYTRKLNGEDNPFDKWHLNNLEKGEIKGVFTACFFDGHEDYKTMQEMILNCNEVIDNHPKLRHVTNSKDLIEDEKILALISVEGMCGIKDDVEEKIEWLYKHNVRVASLVWNESNALADGWPNNPLRGLSEDGFKVVKKMNELNMIIDVSHINEAGFWDIVKTSTKPIIATHSNIRELATHQRNLTVQQCKAIALKGGLIGLNAAGDFINNIKEEQTALNLAKHARFMADLVGVEHIACGFDYMDFIEDTDGLFNDSMALDLKDASYTQNFVEALKMVNFNDEEIEKICFYNVYNFLKEQL